MKDNLLILNRNVSDKDGPSIILDSILKDGRNSTYDVCINFKIFDINEHHPKAKKILFLNFLREMYFLIANMNTIFRYKKIVIFSYYSSPIILMILKIFKAVDIRLITIGYDSFHREYKTKLNKENYFLHRVPYFIKSSVMLLIEYIASKASDKVFLVSDSCIDFSKKNINKNGPYYKFPIIPEIDNNLILPDKKISHDDLIIVGPFITNADFSDLRSNLKELAKYKKEIKSISFFGKGSDRAKRLSSYSGTSYEYLDDFDVFFSYNTKVIIYNRINTPGVQTKLQKIILYSNLVFSNGPTDVGVHLSSYLYDINDFKERYSYRIINKQKAVMALELTQIDYNEIHEYF